MVKYKLAVGTTGDRLLEERTDESSAAEAEEGAVEGEGVFLIPSVLPFKGEWLEGEFERRVQSDAPPRLCCFVFDGEAAPAGFFER